jgi:hypothetical protein
VRGAWCVVRGACAWCVVRGAWCVVRGAWCVVRGAFACAWCVVRVRMHALSACALNTQLMLDTEPLFVPFKSHSDRSGSAQAAGLSGGRAFAFPLALVVRRPWTLTLMSTGARVHVPPHSSFRRACQPPAFCESDLCTTRATRYFGARWLEWQRVGSLFAPRLPTWTV